MFDVKNVLKLWTGVSFCFKVSSSGNLRNSLKPKRTTLWSLEFAEDVPSDEHLEVTVMSQKRLNF